MCLALLAGLLLPLGSVPSAQPENPILHAHAQELTVLETGGGAGADAVQLPEQSLPDAQPQPEEPRQEIRPRLGSPSRRSRHPMPRRPRPHRKSPAWTMPTCPPC